jgi:hypothetical protein
MVENIDFFSILCAITFDRLTSYCLNDQGLWNRHVKSSWSALGLKASSFDYPDEESGLVASCKYPSLSIPVIVKGVASEQIRINRKVSSAL